MNETYRALLEATVDRMIEEGTDRVPLDSLAKASGLGFITDTFERDVEAELADRARAPDRRQHSFHLPIHHL